MPSVTRLIPALIAVFLLAAGTAQALAASSTREIGDFPDKPFPSAGCPATATCQAVGHVTGYQVRIGNNHTNPFGIRQTGRIVAFTIRLGKPTAAQSQFFTNLFGGAPQARLSLLRTERGATKRGHLVSQSEVFNLSRFLGSTPTFTLTKPLIVRSGYTVALTVPTWAPSFAIMLPSNMVWRSSRPSNDCGGTTQAAQQTPGTVRQYVCLYRTARLLYSATFVPNPVPTN
jgi:hypothetical protein